MKPIRPGWWRAYPGGAYLWRGREPSRGGGCSGPGVDCWGLYAWVLPHDFGRPVNDFGWAYPADGDAGVAQARAFAAGEVTGWQAVAWEEGAAALFEQGGIPVHVGVCTAQRGVILHAHEDIGVDLLDINQSLKWKGRFVGCFLPR